MALPLAMRFITSCIEAAPANSYSPALSLVRCPVSCAMTAKMRPLEMMPFCSSVVPIWEAESPGSTMKTLFAASGPWAVYSVWA